MRKLLFILFLVPACLFAQPYSATVDVPGKDAATLYGKAKEWFAESFKSPGVVPPTEDAAQGKLSGKESVSGLVYSNDVAVNINIMFGLKVSVKNEQYKYEVDNIIVEHGQRVPLSTFKNGTTKEGTIQMYKAAGMKTPSKKEIETNIDYSVKVVNKVDAELNRLISSLAEKMTN